jgi:hypothetical protein
MKSHDFVQEAGLITGKEPNAIHVVECVPALKPKDLLEIRT